MLSDKEVLEACITKAIEGGWKPVGIADNILSPEAVRQYCGHFVEPIIFNHGFLQALFGEEKSYELVCPKCDSRYNFLDDDFMEKNDFAQMVYCPYDGKKLKKIEKGRNSTWHYHVQRLAVAENRIQYLRENA